MELLKRHYIVVCCIAPILMSHDMNPKSLVLAGPSGGGRYPFWEREEIEFGRHVHCTYSRHAFLPHATILESRKNSRNFSLFPAYEDAKGTIYPNFG